MKSTLSLGHLQPTASDAADADGGLFCLFKTRVPHSCKVGPWFLYHPASWARHRRQGRRGPVLSCQPPCHGPCRPLLPAKCPPIRHPAAAAEFPVFPIIPSLPLVCVPPPSAACRAAQEPPGGFPGLPGVAGEWDNPARRSSGLPSATPVQWSRRPDVYGVGTYAHDAVGIIAICR